MWSVKESINYISEPLTYIINLSINSGVVPDPMKLARVVPGSSSQMIKDYFPIIGLYLFYQFFPNF